MQLKLQPALHMEGVLQKPLQQLPWPSVHRVCCSLPWWQDVGGCRCRSELVQLLFFKSFKASSICNIAHYSSFSSVVWFSLHKMKFLSVPFPAFVALDIWCGLEQIKVALIVNCVSRQTFQYRLDEEGAGKKITCVFRNSVSLKMLYLWCLVLTVSLIPHPSVQWVKPLPVACQSSSVFGGLSNYLLQGAGSSMGAAGWTERSISRDAGQEGWLPLQPLAGKCIPALWFVARTGLLVHVPQLLEMGGFEMKRLGYLVSCLNW